MSVSIAVLTVSDTRSSDSDFSGKCITEILTAAGHIVNTKAIVKDEESDIQYVIGKWLKEGFVDVIVVTGGTGPSIRDVTPNAIVPMFTSRMPGFGELFRQLSYDEIGSAAMLSRADAGWIDQGLIRIPVFLLPGSPHAVRLAITALIEPQLNHLMQICSQEQKP